MGCGCEAWLLGFERAQYPINMWNKAVMMPIFTNSYTLIYFSGISLE